MFNWIGDLFITSTYQYLEIIMRPFGVFLFFAINGAITVVYVMVFFIETHNKTDIEIAIAYGGDKDLISLTQLSEYEAQKEKTRLSEAKKSV